MYEISKISHVSMNGCTIIPHKVNVTKNKYM